jgi:alpha-beta hydrolase superfamily lysophospholipase
MQDLQNEATSRRTLFKAIVARFMAAGVGTAFVADTLRKAHGGPTADAPLWSAEYWARKGSVELNLWRKRATAPRSGEAPLPVLFFVHGSSLSARTSFDLTVPGGGEYSLMNVFAGLGFDSWTMDHDGYGRSGSSGNSSDIASGVEDLKAAMPVLRRETGRTRFNFYGTSSGAIRAAAFAQSEPDQIDRLVLVAFTYKGTGSPTLQDRAKQVEFYRANNRRRRDRAMIRSIFTRDNLASSYDPGVAEAIAEVELKFGEEVPTGTYLDMTANLPLVDPAKVSAPVAMIRGERDGISSVEDLFDFYRQLRNGDRQFITLPNTAHSPDFAKNRHLLWHATHAFLTAPVDVNADPQQ